MKHAYKAFISSFYATSYSLNFLIFQYLSPLTWEGSLFFWRSSAASMSPSPLRMVSYKNTYINIVIRYNIATSYNIWLHDQWQMESLSLAHTGMGGGVPKSC